MYEILGETIKSALGSELNRNFPNRRSYKEQTTNPQYPHFFLQQLTLNSIEDRKNFWFIAYFMTIRYRHVLDTATITTLEQQLDNISIQLLSELDTIDLSDLKIKVKNTRTEKVDGVLHYFCDIKIQVTKEKMQEILMEELEIKEVIK